MSRDQALPNCPHCDTLEREFIRLLNRAQLTDAGLRRRVTKINKLHQLGLTAGVIARMRRGRMLGLVDRHESR